MGIAEEIARKRADLAAFVNASAAAVLSEEMTDETRGVVALDLVRLMVASGLQTAAPVAMIDITPAPVAHVAAPSRPTARPTAEAIVRAITPPAPKPKRGGNRRVYLSKITDEKLLAAVDEHGHDNVATAALFGVTRGYINAHRRRLR